MQSNMEQKNNYFRELTLNLQREGFTAAGTENSLLSVKMDGQHLCHAASNGEIRYREEDAADGSRRAAIDRVTDIACSTTEYMKLMETAPPLKASGLEGDYRLLAEFNNAVLAGHPTEQGVQFITWERDFDRTGVCWGHYYGEDYEKAKMDFTARSGLVAENRLFTSEQLAEIYRAVGETLESKYPITAERENLLKGVSRQIELAVPTLDRLVAQSNQRELELGDSSPQQGMNMTF